ncbi:hypothetical protein P153DRAFT_168734 [Dothidotthia symphoricarpi CBS 119687]|uniref:Uncharacterized protein n=1 Tax=Dothidotthia symphoricarpi CBS 119687 TaxID=1392245 RepID=A0A6A6AP12_9PLEO|nr:uncharacterized protein P153DRAFT_168734 [Dothidotthia symphoricarpi CBS 119687]KAF2132627.1 hypothetical protein P153DRAFT_168734 [Dothidotthia symphoricarpi CBS 119687]
MLPSPKAPVKIPSAQYPTQEQCFPCDAHQPLSPLEHAQHHLLIYSSARAQYSLPKGNSIWADTICFLQFLIPLDKLAAITICIRFLMTDLSQKRQVLPDMATTVFEPPFGPLRALECLPSNYAGLFTLFTSEMKFRLPLLKMTRRRLV